MNDVKINEDSSSTPDLNRDWFGNAFVKDITETSANIEFTSNEPVQLQIEWGRTVTYGSKTVRENSFLLKHVQPIRELEPGTLYHFRILATNEIGTEMTSSDFTFMTAEEAVLPAVNFKTYGVVGDGVVDDTAALQLALDNESVLVADPGSSFLISMPLSIKQSFAHTIDWNGATLITSAPLNPMVLIDKRGSGAGVTAMRNLLIDGKRVAARGVEISSRVELVDVDATGFRQPTSSSPAGFYINFYDVVEAYGTWIFDGCDVSDVVGASNGVTTDSLGAANGYLIYWRAIPSNTITLDVKNANVSQCWGEDAQNVAIFSPGIDVGGSSSGTRWTNVNFLDWERRSIKAFSANNTFINCSFVDPDPNDSGLTTNNKAGMVVVGRGSGATGGDNQIFEGCTFTGLGYDGRVIVTDSANVHFNNCEWIGGSDILFTSFGQGGIGEVEICGSSFGPGSLITDYGGIQYQGNDVVTLDTDNLYSEPIYITVDPTYYEEKELNCVE